MNIQLSKNTLDLLAKCTEAQATLDAMQKRHEDDIDGRAFTFAFNVLSSSARMLAMSLQADKEATI